MKDKNEALKLTILLRVETLSGLGAGSSDPSGEAVGEVDMGEPLDSAGLPLAGGSGPSSLSRKGFLLLFGEVNGLERPIVANLWPLVKGFLGAVGGEAEGRRKGLVKGLLVAAESMLALLVLVVSWLVTLGTLVLVWPSLLSRLSVKRVSLCTPARPFLEKWVTLTGIWDDGLDTAAGAVGVSSAAVEVGVREASRSSMAAEAEVAVVAGAVVSGKSTSTSWWLVVMSGGGAVAAAAAVVRFRVSLSPP